MGREYEQLECGCLISCDGGGGLIPCSYEDNPNCKSQEYFNMHHKCHRCGECVMCYCNCADDEVELKELVQWYFECLDLYNDEVDSIVDDGHALYELFEMIECAEKQLREAIGMETE